MCEQTFNRSKLVIVAAIGLSLLACSDESSKSKTSSNTNSPVVAQADTGAGSLDGESVLLGGVPVNADTSGTTSTAQRVSTDTPFAYVQRSIQSTADASSSHYQSQLLDGNANPLDLSSPYAFRPGAKLFVRSSLDVNGSDKDILSTYFNSSNYDVKDITVSPNGEKLLFAAHGPAGSNNDSWNIFEYNFITKALRRVISDNTLANQGQDTSPSYALDGTIVFSSDRSAGNPDSPQQNVVEEGSECVKISPSERPSLLHSMTALGGNIVQLTYGNNHDTKVTTLKDGRLAFVRWSRSYDLVPNCEASVSSDISSLFSQSFPAGLNSPSDWENDAICALAIDSPVGPVISTNHFTVLRITSDGSELEQLYETVSASGSDAAYLTVNELVQAENGKLSALISHEYHDFGGGNLVELQAPGLENSSEVFGELALDSLSAKTANLYPTQKSANGWYSALWPYRDGSSRYLISWSQCLLDNGGVKSFCNSNASGTMEARYGVWVYDSNDDTRLPIIRAREDVIYTELALAQPHVGQEFPYSPYNPEFVDDMDLSRIVCPDPSVEEPEEEEPSYPEDPTVTPETPTTDPEDPTVTPETPTTDPEDPTVTPETPTTDPEDPTVTPETPTTDPEDPTVTPETPTTDPEDPTVTPETPTTDPEDPTVTPETPTTDPEDPTVTPETPTTDPEDPTVTPETPETPTTDPEDPTVDPETPTTDPEDPTVDPETPTTDPEDPTVDPETPTTDPEDPGVEPSNTAPVANAGPDQNVHKVTQVTLDGSNSSDAEGDALTYTWSIVNLQDMSASLSSTEGEQVVLSIEGLGTVEVQLTVNDGALDSAPDTIVVSSTNAAPTADAGADQTIETGNSVALDGTNSSDADGDALTYSWSVTSVDDGFSAELSSAESATPSVTISGYGSAELQLIVNDGFTDSMTDTVIVTAVNLAPIANAGADQPIFLAGSVSLDGSGSTDANGDELSFSWSIIEMDEGSNASLSDPSAVKPTLEFDGYGRYVVQLIVNDGLLDSAPDTVVITSGNTAPVANAGEDRASLAGEVIVLDGSGSSDADGDPISYQWEIVERPEGSTAELDDTSLESPVITVDQAGTYVIQLIVNDGDLNSEPDQVVLTSLNNKPIAEAGDGQSADTHDVVLLNGSNSYDPDGDALSFSWSIISKPDGASIALEGAQTSEPSFSADTAGTYVAQLIVNDGTVNSDADTVAIELEAPPVTCDTSNISRRSMPFTMRDFKSSHPDFEYTLGAETGIVKADLGSDGKPVYGGHRYKGTKTTTGEAAFNQWYNTVDGINKEIPMDFELRRNEETGHWEFADDSFFPLDGLGWGNTPRYEHNYHFTLETHLEFYYEGGEVFTFNGDDDLFLFINGKLAIDIGGVHEVISKSISLDEIADYLGIEPGNTYSFDLFFAERHTVESNFMFQTNINLECPVEDAPIQEASFKMTGGGQVNNGGGNFGFNVLDSKNKGQVVHLLYNHKNLDGASQRMQVKIVDFGVDMTAVESGLQFNAGCRVNNFDANEVLEDQTCSVTIQDSAVAGDHFSLTIIDGPLAGFSSGDTSVSAGNITLHK